MMNSVAREDSLVSSDAKFVARNISKHFDGVYAVNGATVSCADNEIVGLIGPNGAGKTTLMNVISGVVRADEGEICLDGTQIEALAPEHCARMGIARTFQNIRVFSKLTVRQNIQVAHATGLRQRSSKRKCATEDELIELLELTAASDLKSETLPYGTQRRVEIARALALGPRVLLLDEPAAGMNEQESEALLQTIREISRRFGFGIIVIDHDLRFIMNVCDRIYVMHMGEIIAHGDPGSVRENPTVREVYLGNRHRDGSPMA